MKYENLRCPNCKHLVTGPSPKGDVFIERGEYNGSEYEEEGDRSTFFCTCCELEFAVVTDAKRSVGRSAQEEKYFQEAKAHYQRDGETEFDDDAMVSMGDDNGAYVQAWVWVENPEPEEEENCGENETS